MVEPISMSIAIASLVSSAPHWFHAIESSALNQGKDFAIGEGKKRFQNYLDERKHTQNIQLALRNAAERGLKQFTTLEERDLYRDVLRVLAEGNSEALRREAIRQLSLSGEPDYKALSEKYNLSQRITALAEKTTHSEVDAAPYLKSFFDALLIELYNDPLFRSQMSDLIRVRAAKGGQRSLEDISETLQRMSGQRSLNDILVALTQIYERLDDTYTPEQLKRDVEAYLNFVERTQHHYSLKGIPLQQGDDSTPELHDIFVPLHVSMMGEDEQREKAVKQDETTVLTLLEAHPYAVLLGGPGAGKSMTTRYLVWSHARVHTTPALPSHPFAVLSGEPVPLRIELRRFSDARKQHPHLSFLSYMTDVFLKQHDITLSVQMFISLLERRAMLVLFDGLDEVPQSERKQFAEDIEIFAQRYPGNRLLVTSRPVGYQAIRLTSRLFQHARVLNFDDKQIRLFIENWYRRVLKRSSLIDEQQEMDLLYNTLVGNARLHELAANPLLLTVMTTLHHQQRLPDKRILIYRDCVHLLLVAWEALKREDTRLKGMKLVEDNLNACLAHLGFVLHKRAQKGDDEEMNDTEEMDETNQRDTAVDVPASFIRKEMKKYLSEQGLLSGADLEKEVEHFHELAEIEAGLLVQRGTNKTENLYGFVHRTFQEYFAAVDIYNRYKDGDTAAISTFLKKYAYDPHWREVVLLLLAQLSPKLVSAQLNTLLSDNDCPRYKDVTQQDLFLVVRFLLEGIQVKNELVLHVLARLRTLVDSSPFPSQRREAIYASVQLQRSKFYIEVVREHMKQLIQAARTTDLRSVIEIAQVFYLYNPYGSEEKAEGRRMLLHAFKAGSASEQVQVAKVIYAHSSFRLEEKAEGRRMLLEVFNTGDLSVDEQVQVAKVIWGNDRSSVEEVRRRLLEVFNTGSLSVSEQVQVAQAIYRYCFVGSSEEEVRRCLLEELKTRDLSVDEQAQVAEVIYRNSKWEERRMLLEVFKAEDLSVSRDRKMTYSLRLKPALEYTKDVSVSKQKVDLMLAKVAEDSQRLIEIVRSKIKAGRLSATVQVAKLVYGLSSWVPEERAFAIDLIAQLIQQQEIPVHERVQLAILPCTIYKNNFWERLEAVRMVRSLISKEDAKTLINEKWNETPLSTKTINKEMLETGLSSSDIDAIYELTKMDVLPDELRDEMYNLLNRIVAVRGMVEHDEDEDD